MMRWLRRLILLSAFTGGVYVGYRVWSRRPSSPTTATPEWPPLVSVVSAVEPVGEVKPRWVVAVNGLCPDGYTVKANDHSKIYHMPGGRFYARTVPERCYANADDAIADGYRPAKA